MKQNIVMVGDFLGTIEEFMPGEGTYAEDGRIYASTVGNAIIDRRRHLVRIDGKSPLRIETGQIVFGDVMKINKNIVTVILRKIRGYAREVDIKAGIYVSQITDSYVKAPEDMFGIGDIVMGRIIKMERGLVDLTTKGNLGVVKAFCKRCRTPLNRADKLKDILICPTCGSNERRKIASEYGVVKVL